MTHISNCMRPDVDKANVYIALETSPTKSPVSWHFPFTLMLHQGLRRSHSLKETQIVKETVRAPERRPSRLGLQQQSTTSKYQLWPPASRSLAGLARPLLLSDRSMALSMGRSPTSLSDTAVSPENIPFWHRGGSLSRRRKISVPELGSTMTTVQETTVDSRKLANAAS